MNLPELHEALEQARDTGRTVGPYDEVPGWMLHALTLRLDAIDRRGQQIRGGLKPHARPPEVVDFLLAEPGGTVAR
jgi:hypothetical protein